MIPTLRTGVVIGTWPTGLPRRGQDVIGLGLQVEKSGLDLLFAGDHLFGHTPSADALATLSALAAVTERVVLGTAVLLLPLREPAVVAKQAATIDYLSGGRFVFGVGVGGEVDKEWNAMEVSRTDRGRRTDEYLELVRALWSGGVVAHEGTYRRVAGVVGSPTPTRSGGPPVWIGGRSDAALERAARHEGWCAYAMSPRGLRERVQQLEENFPDGRPDGFRVAHVLFATANPSSRARARSVAAEILQRRYQSSFDDYLDSFCALGPPDAIAERLRAYRQAGAEDVLFSIQAPTSDLSRQIDLLAEAAALASA